ncbi:hypothetical protein DQ04_13721010 [Trypanosoma grayi]|uniref:hypothetical protein n=1 Tax=Trypanosoma grayi TaxID=71804 RepID=UPI0004F46476|nr:hypothetical protein DQ04_13721010 [Trypanosoma grayi]KEG06481.1 hypothetical protein DQ04_13721010 [Trypanosoma grayi]
MITSAIGSAESSVGRRYIFMGGDAMYSSTKVTDKAKRCLRGIRSTALNCIYRWNLGRFADATEDGWGVPFFRGSYAGPATEVLNGYPIYWAPNYPKNGQVFVISRVDSATGVGREWLDGLGVANLNVETPPFSFVVVCEVQEGYDPNATSLPPVVVLSWAQKYWYVILIIVLVPVIIALALLIICCCCCGRNEDEEDDKSVVPMVMREQSGMSLRPAESSQGGFDGNYEGDPGYVDQDQWENGSDVYS